MGSCHCHNYCSFSTLTLTLSSNLSCSAALCPGPVDIANGMVTFTGNSVGDAATYSCNSGFELIGGVTTTCTQVDPNSAAFSSQAPFCRRAYCMTDTTVATCLLICMNHTRTKVSKNSQYIHFEWKIGSISLPYNYILSTQFTSILLCSTVF